MNELQFEPQQKRVLSHEIYLTLRDAILSGKLEPGERLIENSIATQMGVSRAPLREAMRQLGKDGLIESKAHRETRVVSFSLNDIQELHIIRTVLETLAYQYAAQRISSQDLSDIEKLVERIEYAAEVGDSQMLAEYDYEFHEKLCQLSGWPRLYRIWKDQHVLLRLWFNAVAKSHGSFMRATAKDHRRMMEAIKAKDQAKIADEVFHHIYYSGPAFKDERTRWAKDVVSHINLHFNGLALASLQNSDNRSDASERST